MVKKDIDNSVAWNGSDALNFIRKFISENISYLREENSNIGDKYDGFRVEYRSEEVIIKFSNPKGELNYEVFVNGIQRSLLTYDERMKEVYVCSKINLELTLNVLLKFLKEEGKLS